MQNSSTHPVRLEQLSDEKLKHYTLGCAAAFFFFLFAGSESGPTYVDDLKFSGNVTQIKPLTEVVQWQSFFTGMRTSYQTMSLQARFVQPCLEEADPNGDVRLCKNKYFALRPTITVRIRGLSDAQLSSWRSLPGGAKAQHDAFDTTGDLVGSSCTEGADSQLCDHQVDVACQADHHKCDWFTLLDEPQVRYADYIVRTQLYTGTVGEETSFSAIEFQMVHGTPSETWYLGLFKYGWAAAAWLAHRRYKEEVGRLRAQSRSEEQLLLTHVVFALVLFNDPLYLLEVGLGGVLLPIVATMGEVTYWTLLLLFWAVAVDRTRLEAEDKRFERAPFYAEKLKVAGAFWTATVFLFCDNLRNARSNPVPGTGLPGFMVSFCQLVAVGCVAGYVLWIGGIVWALYDTRELQALSQRFQFLLCVSGATCGVACFGAIICGYFGVMSTNMGEYTGFYSLFNIYTLYLAFLYSPAPGNAHVSLPEPTQSPSPLPSDTRGRQREIEMANSVAAPSPAHSFPSQVDTGSFDFGTDALEAGGGGGGGGGGGDDPFGNPRLARGLSTGGPVTAASLVPAADKSVISMGDIEHSFSIGDEVDSDGEMEGDTEIEL